MKEADVPQDTKGSNYGGVRKLIYAVNDDGEFVGVKSTGWSVEAQATQTALDQFKKNCADSLQRAHLGQTAILEYYMYSRRMDLSLLAQTTGFFKWRIRRHLKPLVYAKLSNRVLAKYAQALEIDINELKTIPQPPL